MSFFNLELLTSLSDLNLDKNFLGFLNELLGESFDVMTCFLEILLLLLFEAWCSLFLRCLEFKWVRRIFTFGVWVVLETNSFWNNGFCRHFLLEISLFVDDVRDPFWSVLNDSYSSFSCLTIVGELRFWSCKRFTLSNAKVFRNRKWHSRNVQWKSILKILLKFYLLRYLDFIM